MVIAVSESTIKFGHKVCRIDGQADLTAGHRFEQALYQGDAGILRKKHRCFKELFCSRTHVRPRVMLDCCDVVNRGRRLLGKCTQEHIFRSILQGVGMRQLRRRARSAHDDDARVISGGRKGCFRPRHVGELCLPHAAGES